jgi:hypothetical protein
MPPGASLDATSKAKLQDWQRDGLRRDCDSGASQGYQNLNDIEQSILDDLNRIDPFQRQETRYLVVKDGYLPGANKAINSVSTAEQLKTLELISEGVYRLNLLDFDLTRTEWQVLERFDRVDLESFTPNGILIKALTGARKPWLHGRNFSFVSHDAPVYYFLLGIPRTLREFLALDFIDVDLDDEFRRLRPRLIGFNGSVISRNKNRLIGRFEGRHGYLWFTWDVLDANNRGSNLFEEPLVAEAGGQADFRFDGSELIGTLPNGGQVYYLSDANGNRVDEAPVTLVFDTESPFDPEIRNGLDCHRCHGNGLLPNSDQIRDHVIRNAGQFDANDVRRVQFLYPRNELSLFNIDNGKYKRFIDAVGQGDSGDINDAINTSTDYLRSDYGVDKSAELFFVRTSELIACISQDATLQSVIGNLLTGGTVSFDQFQQRFYP